MITPGTARRAARFATETNLYIALGAATYAASTTWYADGTVHTTYPALVGCATLFTYNAQRLLGDLDRVRAFRYWKIACMAAGLCGAVVLARHIPTTVLLILIAAGALALAYALPVVKMGGAWLSLRRLPFTKLPLVWGVWMVAGVLIPFAMQPPVSAFGGWLIAIHQGALVASLALCFDLRDLEVDFPGQLTVPQLLGWSGTLSLVQYILLLGSAACALAFLMGAYSMLHFATALASLGAVWVASKCVRPMRGPLYFEIAVDGALLLPLLPMLCTYAKS